MSRAQAQLIEELQEDLRTARTKVAELKAEMRGERRGKALVAEQLAADVRLGATREERHRVTAARAYADMQRLLRIIAAHVIDVQETAESKETAEMTGLLRDEIEAAGISLRSAFITVQVERADSAAKVTAQEAVAAVVQAPSLVR